MASVSKYDPDQPRDDHGRFGSGGGGGKDAPMHERTAPGGDLHERATASLRTNAFALEHQHRLGSAGDEVRAKYPRHEQYTDAVHNQAQQAIHTEAMRIHHEQDAIGGIPRLQEIATRERDTAQWRHENLDAQHASVMAELQRARPFALEAHQRDLDAQSRGFADHNAEQAHHQSLRDADAQSRGFANQEAETEHLQAEQERTERAAENKAIAAGHLFGEVGDVVDRYVSGDEARRAAAEQHAEALDRAHGTAADALAALHAYGSEEHEHLDTSGIVNGEHFNDAQTSFREALGLVEHGGYERDVAHHDVPLHPNDASLMTGERYQPHEQEAHNAPFAHHAGLEYVPHPDNSEHELTDEEHAHQLAAHKAWSARAEAVHAEAMAAHEAEFKRRAEAAQTALEQLHERQFATHEHLRSTDKESDKAHREATKKLEQTESDDLVNHAAFAHHERDYGTEGNKPAHPSDAHDPEYLVNDHAREDYESAHAAAETMLARASDRLENHSHLNVDDVFEPLKDSMRSTRDSIKALAKITGRAARLPAKAKKSTNRPGAEPGGSVWGMAPAKHKLKLSTLKFLSLVDVPAQEPATVRLIKRAPQGDDEIEIKATARIVKVGPGDDPLIYAWAFQCVGDDGNPYSDLQGDTITPDFIKAAEEFMSSGGAVDTQHNEKQSSRCAFSFPMDSDIATSMFGAPGAAIKTVGLMTAIRASADDLAQVRAGKLNGISIMGTGTREPVKAAGTKCPSCGAYGKADDKGNCPSCGKAMKRVRRTKRLAPTRKQAVLTSAVDGHQHQIDLDDPADGWSDQLTTSYNTSEGADSGHQHAWVYDAATGKITIAEDSGHSHTVDAVVPADVIRQAALNESGERCPGCGEMCEAGCRFCSKCGCAMDRRDAVPAAASDEGSGSAPAVILISARAPAAISPPSGEVSTVKDITEEQQMADPNELAALKAENALLKHMSSLTDAARDHHNRLLAKGIKSDADAFLVLDKAQRAAVLAEIAKSDAEVYTSKSNGKVYRMSDSVEIIEAAKQSDAMAETMKRLETERSEIEFTKAAIALIPNCLKGVKNNVPQRLIKAARAEFKDAAEFAEFEKAMKQYEAALAMLSKSVGYSSVDDTATDTPAKRFESAINDYAKRNNLSIPAAIAKATESDAEIRRLYNEASLLAS